MALPPRARPGEINAPFVDRFTAAHALIGAAYAWIGLPAWGALLLALAWEWLENPLKARVPRLFPHATRDTWRNAFGDVLAVMGGWGVVHALGA